MIMFPFLILLFTLSQVSGKGLNVSLKITSGQNDIFGHSDFLFLTLDEGRDLDVNCQVEETNDEPLREYDLNWYVPDSLMNRVEPEKSFNNYRIKVRNITAKDRGPMTCTARIPSEYHSEIVEDAEQAIEPIKQKVILKVRPNSSGNCGSNFFQCSESSLCIIRRYACDGLKDCPHGEDESEAECGLEPCHAKLKCDDDRCMDPALCCIPQVHHNCTSTPSCCKPIIDSINHFYHLGVETRKQHDIKYLHTTVYIVVGCVMTFIALIAFVTVIICRLHIRRNQLDSSNSNRRNRPFVLYDIDFLYSLIQRHGNDDNQVRFGITYNINNGVQILNNPNNNNNNNPPPYGIDDPPPPYGEQEQNNNGDINGNSDYVDQNIAQQQQAQQENPRNDPEAAAAAENDHLLPNVLNVNL